MSAFKNPTFYRNSQSAQNEIYESYNGKPYNENDTFVSRKDGEADEVKQAYLYLRKLLKPGMTVYTILNHVSTSGMQRCISLAIGGKKGEIIKLDWHVAKAMKEKIDNKHGGIKVGGCGMDMGFSLVYSLGRTLWPTGTSKQHGSRNGKPDSDGGYALKQSWL